MHAFLFISFISLSVVPTGIIMNQAGKHPRKDQGTMFSTLVYPQLWKQHDLWLVRCMINPTRLVATLKSFVGLLAKAMIKIVARIVGDKNRMHPAVPRLMR